MGVVRVWGLVWGIGPPSSSHSIHQSPSPHNLPAIHTTLAWGGNRGWRVDVACWWGVGGPSNPTVSPHTPHPNTTPTSTSQHACSSMGSCVGLMLVLWVSCEVGNVSLCGGISAPQCPNLTTQQLTNPPYISSFLITPTPPHHPQ